MRGVFLLHTLLLLISTRNISSFSSSTSNHQWVGQGRILYPVRTRLFLAKKKVTRKKKNASTSKGFGEAPPTLEEVASQFKNRFPDDTENISEAPCACGSGKTYGTCCGYYHRTLDEDLPETNTPIDLLRSRYTAFAWRLPLYVMESTHPTCSDFRKDKLKWVKDLNKSGMFDSYEFAELKDISQIEQGSDDNEAFVTFKVSLRANENTGPYLQGQEITIQEKSKFLRDGEPLRWRYASGDITSEIQGIENVKLNN